MRIEKRNYSQSPWRLVNDEGKEITAKMPFEHPTLGWTYIDGPICGDTKAECVQKALDVLKLLMLRQQHGVNAPQPAQEPVAWVREHELPLAPGDAFSWVETCLHKTPLYTSPQPSKPWVGLTPEERQACTQSPFTSENYLAIEAKLKEKNA